MMRNGMTTMSDNYPDDIRNYDHDPRSPFYEGGTCPECREDLECCECEEGDDDE